MSKKSATALLASFVLAATPAAALAGGKDGGKGGGKGGPKDPPSCKKNDKKKECDSIGRMTGGGSVFGSNSFRTTHGFQIRCSAPNKSNLEVNWDSGNRFHATSFSNLVCDGPPTTKPAAPFSRLTGQAEGRYNGAPATAWFQFTDVGEPGTSDVATILVFDEDGNVVLNVSGTLKHGNHQAHK
jgi:hypothetical protein